MHGPQKNRGTVTGHVIDVANSKLPSASRDRPVLTSAGRESM
jgi:hypothetical protein